MFYIAYKNEYQFVNFTLHIIFCCSQGASALTPGDSKAFKALLRTLPIESALTNSTPRKTSPAKSTHGGNTSFASGYTQTGNRATSPFSATGRTTLSGTGMF